MSRISEVDIYRDVNLEDVNPGDDILEVDIPGDVNLFKSPH